MQDWKKQIDTTSNEIRVVLDGPEDQKEGIQHQEKIIRAIGESPRDKDVVLLAISKFVYEKLRGTIQDYTNNLYSTVAKVVSKVALGGTFTLSDINDRTTLCTCLDKASAFDVIAREVYEIDGRVRKLDGFLNMHHYWEEGNGKEGAIFDNYYGKRRFGFFPDKNSHKAAIKEYGHYLAVIYQDIRRKLESVHDFLR